MSSAMPSRSVLAPSEDEGWADWIARCFHTEYERIAPQFGYGTRPDSAVAWEQVPETNKRLMRSVVASLCARGVIDLGDAWDTAPEGDNSPTPCGTCDRCPDEWLGRQK